MASGSLSTIFANTTQPKFYWDFRTGSPTTDENGTYVTDIMNVDSQNLKAVATHNASIDAQGALFDTVPNSYEEMEHIAIDPFTFGGQHSIEIYFNRATLPNGNESTHWQGLVTFIKDGGSTYRISSGRENANTLGFANFADGVYPEGSLITSNVWNHLVMTADANGVWKAYLNNTLDTTFSMTHIPDTVQRDINWVGSVKYGQVYTEHFYGRVGYVRIWQDHVLTESEVSNLYNTRETAYGSSSGSSSIPVLTLVGDASLTISKGSTYTDAGATAQDDTDGDITSSIVVTGTVDTNTSGTYTLTYNVTNSVGNTATPITRTITVTSVSSSSSGNLSTIFTNTTQPKFYWDFRTGSPTTDENGTYVTDIMNVDSQNLKAVATHNASIDAQGALFDTVPNSYEEMEHIAIDPFTFGGQHSIEIYFNRATLPNGNESTHWQGLVTFIKDGGSTYRISSGRENANTLGFANFADGVYPEGSLITSNVWNHLVMTADANGVWKAYLNNTLDTTFSMTHIPDTVQRDINWVGSVKYGQVYTEHFYGRVGYVRIWQDHVLTESEVSNLYNTRETTYSNSTPVGEDIVKVIQTMKIDGKSVSELSTSEKADIVANTTTTYIPITRTMLQDNGIDDTQYNDAQITDMIRIALADGSIMINIVIEFPPDLTGSISTATVNDTLTNMLTTVQNNMLDLVKTATGDVTLTLNPVSGTIDVAQAQTDVNATNVPDLPAENGNNFVFTSISKGSVSAGASNADKRAFTKNSISSLLTKYQNHLSSGKNLKLQAGVSIPGFDSIPATDEVFLFDARVTKTFTRSQLMKKRTYMVLNDNEPVTFYTTTNKTVIVTQNGTSFTVVKSDGSQIVKSAGDTIVDDGLNMTFGSVSTYLEGQPPIDMVLDVFDSAFTLSSQALLPDLSYQITASAEILLTQQISASDLSAVFYFKTDEDITSLPSDSSNVMYYLDRSKWTGGQATLNPMNGIITSGYYGSNTTDNLAKDFLRDMAQHLFNTHFGVDLFTNEDAVVSNISTNAASKATDIYNMMGAVDITNTGLEGPDASNNYYKKDDTSNTNLTREILNQLLTAAPGRFDDKVALRLNSDVSGCYGMPFIAGDTLSYKLYVTANSNQHLTINTGKPQLNTRTYKVVFKAS